MQRSHHIVQALLSTAQAVAEHIRRRHEAGEAIIIELIDGSVVRRQKGQPDMLVAPADDAHWLTRSGREREPRAFRGS